MIHIYCVSIHSASTLVWHVYFTQSFWQISSEYRHAYYTYCQEFDCSNLCICSSLNLFPTPLTPYNRMRWWGHPDLGQVQKDQCGEVMPLSVKTWIGKVHQNTVQKCTYKLLMAWLLSLKIFKNLNSKFRHSKNSICSPKHNKVTYKVSCVFLICDFMNCFYLMLDWAWTVKTHSTILKLKTADRNLTARGKALTLTIFVALPLGAWVDGEDGGGGGGRRHELDGV